MIRQWGTQTVTSENWSKTFDLYIAYDTTDSYIGLATFDHAQFDAEYDRGACGLHRASKSQIKLTVGRYSSTTTPYASWLTIGY